MYKITVDLQKTNLRLPKGSGEEQMKIWDQQIQIIEIKQMNNKMLGNISWLLT